jgi:hypothetical protein
MAMSTYMRRRLEMMINFKWTDAMTHYIKEALKNEAPAVTIKQNLQDDNLLLKEGGPTMQQQNQKKYDLLEYWYMIILKT